MARLTIGELSRLTVVKGATIAWDEAEGWLPAPGRAEGGHRSNGDTHLRRLGFIRHARELGFPMEQIRSLLDPAGRPGDDCSAAHAIAMADIAEVSRSRRRGNPSLTPDAAHTERRPLRRLPSTVTRRDSRPSARCRR